MNNSNVKRLKNSEQDWIVNSVKKSIGFGAKGRRDRKMASWLSVEQGKATVFACANGGLKS